MSELPYTPVPCHSLSDSPVSKIPLSEIYYMYDITDSARMAAGILPLLDCPPGTVSRTQSAT